MRHPREMGSAEVNAFLSDLELEGLVRARTRRRLPVVLTPEEVRVVLKRLTGAEALVAGLLYGSGLRLMEALRLRVQDLNFGRRELIVRDGKGGKDRRTLLPNRLGDQLKQHLRKVRDIHQADLAAGYGRVELPHALARKYPNAPVEWGWQWGASCAGPCWRAASIKPPRRILSVTPSLPICWSVDRTSARSRS